MVHNLHQNAKVINIGFGGKRPQKGSQPKKSDVYSFGILVLEDTVCTDFGSHHRGTPRVINLKRGHALLSQPSEAARNTRKSAAKP
ncbi:hypothetical protein M758_8G166900 [Ceratodon purpureus]|nr:hypothetical protein M758_8G166900 [Ceratodon purpureus]